MGLAEVRARREQIGRATRGLASRWARGSGRGRLEGGFGLVELVVAMGILAVISLVMVRGMTESFGASLLARQRSAAAGVLQTDDALVQSMPASSLASPTAPAVTIDGVTYTSSLTSTLQGGGGGAAQLYLVDMTVSWPGCGSSCTLSGTTEASGT